MASPPVIIIIGPHAHHFATLEEARHFLSQQAEKDEDA